MRKKIIFCSVFVLFTLSITALFLTKSAKVEVISGTLLANIEAFTCGSIEHDQYYCGGGGGSSPIQCYETRSSLSCICSSRPNPSCDVHFGVATRAISCEDCFSIGIIDGNRYICNRQ